MSRVKKNSYLHLKGIQYKQQIRLKIDDVYNIIYVQYIIRVGKIIQNLLQARRF